jgi:phosphoserine phosphatase RsbU/P
MSAQSGTAYRQQSPPVPPPPLPPRQNIFDRIGNFWQRVTEGLELQQLWRQFQTEARSGYRLYSRDVQARSTLPEGTKGSKWHTFKEFFWAVLMKLSPAKRIVLLIGLVLLLVPVVQITTDGGNTSSNEGMRIFGGLAILLVLILETADRVTMKRDLEIAKEIQRWLVPSEAPVINGLDVAFITRAANTVAGDYYDVVPRAEPNKYLLAIADVAGKSMPAALLMATFQASLKTLSSASPSLIDLVYGLNRYACDHSISGSRFTTAFLAEYDSNNCTLTYVNAGHNPPTLLRGQETRHLDKGGVPLGILHDAKYESETVQLRSNDLLAIFTDGVVEAENVAGQEFGEDRLLQVLRMVPNQSAAEVIRHVMWNIETFVATAPQHDDITCMIVRCTK